MTHDPIVCLVSTFREGELVQGALRSILPLGCDVIVYEGATSAKSSPTLGRRTDLGDFFHSWPGRLWFTEGEWRDEAAKRNAMLDHARTIMEGRPFWALTLDADEILLWAEYLPDWLAILHPSGPPDYEQSVLPLKEIQPGEPWTEHGPATMIHPSRCVHSSFLGEYVTGLVVARTPDGALEANFTWYPSPLPPVQGEPHLHHRYYLRTGDRAELRSYRLEAEELEKAGRLHQEVKL